MDTAVATRAMIESDPSEPARVLRDRYADHGYLLLRGVLPADDVLALRRDVLGLLDTHGWLDRTHPVDAGVVDHDAFSRVPDEVVAAKGLVVGEEVYGELYRLESFHRLAHHPALVRACRTLLDAEVLVHPRTIARVMIPSDRVHPTPAHQDFIHVQGSGRCVTSWLPLGDCPRELGSLTVLAGSHRDGVLSYHRAKGAGDLEAYLCEQGYAWHEADLAVGDLLLFTSLTVHRALPNRTGDRIRLSVDYRYQPIQDPIDRGSLLPHVGVCSWEEVYADWPADSELRYFWRDIDPEVSPWDPELRWQQDRIC